MKTNKIFNTLAAFLLFRPSTKNYNVKDDQDLDFRRRNDLKSESPKMEKSKKKRDFIRISFGKR